MSVSETTHTQKQVWTTQHWLRQVWDDLGMQFKKC